MTASSSDRFSYEVEAFAIVRRQKSSYQEVVFVGADNDDKVVRLGFPSLIEVILKVLMWWLEGGEGDDCEPRTAVQRQVGWIFSDWFLSSSSRRSKRRNFMEELASNV